MPLCGMYGLVKVQNGLDNRTKINSDDNSRLSTVSELRSLDTKGGPSAPKNKKIKVQKQPPSHNRSLSSRDQVREDE